MKKVIWFLVIVLIIILAVMWNRPAPSDQEAAGIKTQTSTAPAPVMLTFNNSTSTPMQYIVPGGSTTPPFDVSIPGVLANNSGSPITITEIGFKLNGNPYMLTQLSFYGYGVGGSGIVNGVFTIQNLNLNFPTGNTPIIGQYATRLIFAGLPNVAGLVSSGDTSYLTLDHIIYKIGATTYSLCATGCTYNIANIPASLITSNTYMVSGSKPSNMSFVQPTTTLANGTNKLASVVFTSPSSLFGQFRVKALPISLTSTGSAAISNGTLKVVAGNATCATGANLINPTTVNMAAGGTANVVANFLSNGVLVSPGTTVSLHICATNVSGIGASATNIKTVLAKSMQFRWQDITGNNPADFTSQNGTYLMGYPTNTSTISNSVGGTTGN